MGKWLSDLLLGLFSGILGTLKSYWDSRQQQKKVEELRADNQELRDEVQVANQENQVIVDTHAIDESVERVEAAGEDDEAFAERWKKEQADHD